jgi:phosphatidylserine decarboxylase
MPGEILDNRGRGSAGFTWPAIHPEGRKFGAIAGAICIIGALLGGSLLGWPLAVLTLGVLAFFRDPERVTPRRAGLIISPADGRIVEVAEALPPAELGLEAKPMMRVAIFMNVFDVHVNRSPITATVVRIAYRPGKFLNASLDKASVDNERNALAVRLPDGRDYAVVQIAGLVARRIVCDVKAGQTLRTGERFGMIRFGSRLDIYLPPGVQPLIALGQSTLAGETVLADLTSDEPARLGRTI